VVFTAGDHLNVLVSEGFQLCGLRHPIEVAKGLQVEAELALVCIAAAEHPLLLRKEEGVLAARTQVFASFDVDALRRVLTVTRTVGLQAQSAVESLPPTVGGTIVAECEAVSVSTGYLGNVADAVDECGHIDRAHL
jgi:hypothetical protein